MNFSVAIYNLGIRLYSVAASLAAVGDAKARQWVKGRKGLMDRIRRELPEGGERIWIHCSSLGEFEQGRTVIEGIRSAYPSVKIVLTFFSPSGYEVRKNYGGADHIFYLPPDTRSNAIAFIEIVRPSLALFIKYEFWYHYLTELHARRIPALLISAVFREGQPFFKWYGALFLGLLRAFDHIFVQDDDSAGLLKRAGISQVTVGGDTRFDRVAEVASAAGVFPAVERFTGGNKVLVAGSTWPEDEKILAEFCRQRLEMIQVIIAPHEVDEDHLRWIELLFEGEAIRYSGLEDTDPDIAGAKQILLIDNIGMLSSLYRYGFAAYIGGGFGRDGIHNVLEAAVFGMPVFFGPNYEKYREAADLVRKGAAFPFDDLEEFSRQFDTVTAEEALQAASKTAAGYVRDHTGATRKILGYIAEKRFFTRA